MNRRSLLKTILGAGAALVGGRAIAEEKPPLLQVMHPDKKKTYKDLYWEAQRHIDELYDVVPLKQEGSSVVFDSEVETK